MKYLSDQKCTVIAMRDLVKYVEPAPLTKIPLRRAEGSFVSADTHRTNPGGKVR